MCLNHGLSFNSPWLMYKPREEGLCCFVGPLEFTNNPFKHMSKSKFTSKDLPYYGIQGLKTTHYLSPFVHIIPWATQASLTAFQSQITSPSIPFKQLCGGLINLHVSQLQWSSQKHVFMLSNVPEGHPLAGRFGIISTLKGSSMVINKNILKLFIAIRDLKKR